MALKLTNFDAPHIAVLNQWANKQDTQVQSHTTQLKNLNQFIENLFVQNPTLVRPSTPKQSK
jgi:hypothetical protein